MLRLYGTHEEEFKMAVYFGKDLRIPIYRALKAVATYLDNIFDVKMSTLSEYETKVEASKARVGTLYAITDAVPQSYTGRSELYNCLCGGYLGSTELVCGTYGDGSRLFNKEDS
jgi:hypothetical protein